MKCWQAYITTSARLISFSNRFKTMTVLTYIFYFILMLHVIRYIYWSITSIHFNIRKVCNRKRIDEYKFLPVTDVSQGKLLKIAVLVFCNYEKCTSTNDNSKLFHQTIISYLQEYLNEAYFNTTWITLGS